MSEEDVITLNSDDEPIPMSPQELISLLEPPALLYLFSKHFLNYPCLLINIPLI